MDELKEQMRLKVMAQYPDYFDKPKRIRKKVSSVFTGTPFVPRPYTKKKTQYIFCSKLAPWYCIDLRL